MPKRTRRSHDEILQRAKDGLALNPGELAVALGYSPRVISQWLADGLPLVDGKLPMKEAWAWRKNYLAAHLRPPKFSVSHLIPPCLR